MDHPFLTLLMAFSFVLFSISVDAQRERIQTDTGIRPSVSFQLEVLPLLDKRCNRCHEPNESRSGLDLTRVDTIQRGGDELGAGIVPGNPDSSPLIHVLTDKAEPAMPSEGGPLSETEINLLRRWIQEGAKDDSQQFLREDVDFFEREIWPLLFAPCFKCHASGWLQAVGWQIYLQIASHHFPQMPCRVLSFFD
jgi:hypothetical protein